MSSNSSEISSVITFATDEVEDALLKKGTTYTIESHTLQVQVEHDEANGRINLKEVVQDRSKAQSESETPSENARTNSPSEEKLRLLNCLEALKFKAPTPTPPREKSESASSSKSLVGNNNSPTTSSRMGRKLHIKSTSSVKSKPKVAASFDRTFDTTSAWLSGQPEVQKEGEKMDKSQSGFATVLKGWGKRPLLVESEAPWTRRNKMYTNAIKALEKAKHIPDEAVKEKEKNTANLINNNNNNNINNNNNNNNVPMNMTPGQLQMIYPPDQLQRRMIPAQDFQSLGGQPGQERMMHHVTFLAPPGNNSPVSRISPLPPEYAPTRSLAVPVESPYPYQEIMLPVETSSPPIIFENLNRRPSNVWVPLYQPMHRIQEQQQFQQQMRQQRQLQEIQQLEQFQHQMEMQRLGQQLQLQQQPYYYRHFDDTFNS